MGTEPVQPTRRRRRVMSVGLVLTAGAFAAPAATTAQATPQIHSDQQGTTLSLESPQQRSVVADTTEFVFSGTDLDTVVLYWHGQRIASGEVDASGTAALAVVDTVPLGDGVHALRAVGYGPSHRGQRAVEVFTVKVDNAHADGHPDGARLVFADEFSGDELDRNTWCTRYQFWEPTSQPAQAELAATDPACYRVVPLGDTHKASTTNILNQYKAEAAEAAASGEDAIASWYDERFAQIAANMGVADNGDGTYDFTDAHDPAYGFHDTLGGFDIRPAPGAPQWELPQEEEVYRDVTSDGDPTHTVQDGYLSMVATHTRQEAPVLQYESAMIRSQAEFLPTWDDPLYITARVRAPEVLGTFPAVWLINGFGDGTTPIGWPPEIDVYEGPYNNDGTFPTGGQFANQYHVGLVDYLCEDACGPVTWFDYGDVLGETADDTVGFDTTYHDWHADGPLVGQWVEVGLAWYQDRVCFYADGAKFACATYRWGLPGTDADGPLANPATLILNHAFGGRWGGANGEEVDKLPASFDVDHVRVYELPATTPDELTPIP